MATELYSVDYSFCLKDSGFQRILLLSSFIDSLQYLEVSGTSEIDSTALSSGNSKGLDYFRIFRVKSSRDSHIEGYVFIIEDNGIGSVVVPIKRINTLEDKDTSKINEFIRSSIIGVMSHIRGQDAGVASVMVSKEFVDLFNEYIKDEDKYSTSSNVDNNYVLRSLKIDLINYRGDYIFEEISDVSFECESLVDRLVFSDEYDIEVKLLQLKSISYNLVNLISILKQRYHENSPDPHSMNGKFHPNLLDYIQAAYVAIDYEKLVFYGYLREKNFKISHIYSLLYNRYMTIEDYRSIRSGFVVLDSFMDYLRPDELETLKSLLLEDDFIFKLISSDVDIELKKSIFFKLFRGQKKYLKDMVYKIVETYSNLNLDYIITDQELSLLKLIISSLKFESDISFNFLSELKFMVFRSKRANTLGVELIRTIFELQKMKKCTLKFSVNSQER